MSGRIRDEDLEELRRRVDLAEVAAEHVTLKRAGRLFKARCPFHTEKTPSFSLDPAKGLFHCFGCGKGGDAFTLVQELEGLTFAEAAERLARRTGIELRYERVTPRQRAEASRRERLIDLHRQAAAHYHETLMGEGGAAARSYLRSRGFARETVEAFEVGLAPPRRDELTRRLLRRGAPDQDLVEGGLTIRTERGLLDRFRARLTFPIHDLTGNPVGFGARLLDAAGDGPKYLNSPESPIYHKGRVLYALHRAKGPIVKAGRAVVVEGYTDVLALHQAGIPETIATCGTALGDDHLRLLARFAQRVVVAFDSDAAGQAAAERAFAGAQAAGLDVRVLILPDGSDPAEFVAARGPDAFRALIEEAVPIIEFRLRREVARFRTDEPEERARALRAATPILAAVDDEVIRSEYARRLAGWIQVDPALVFRRFEGSRGPGRPAAESRRIDPQVRYEREAIKLALQHPEAVAPAAEAVSAEDFSHPTLRRVWEEIRAGGDSAQVAARLPEGRARRAFTELAVEPPEGSDGSLATIARISEEIFGRLQEFALGRQIEQVKSQLERLNPEVRRQEYDEIVRELFALEGRKRRLSTSLQGEG